MITLTDAWYPLKYHPVQSLLWRTTARFVAVAAGRRSGKTEICRRKIIRLLPIVKPWSDPLYFYALPTRDQAKKVAWPKLKALVPKHWLAHNGISESELSITTRFGSKLFVLGMDKPARAEGVGWDYGIMDESCDHRPGSFDLSIRPALSDRVGGCCRIGVPKRSGPGAQDFKEFYEAGVNGTDEDILSLTWPSSDIVAPEEIESAKRQLDEKDFNEQYNASWETVGGAIYYAFSDIYNVSDEITYNPDLPLLIGCDFNVDPMAWAICQVSNGKLRVLDELHVKQTNTLACLRLLKQRYPDHKPEVVFFGDASSQSRHTSASESDYVQIRNFDGWTNKKVMFPAKNPDVCDRFASCNAMFCNAANERRCMVHPRCKNLIEDLRMYSYKKDSSEPDKTDTRRSHSSDGFGYLVHYLFPLRVEGMQQVVSVPRL